MIRFRIFVSAAVLGLLSACVPPAVAEEFVAKSIVVPELKAVFGQVESYTILPARAQIGGTLREITVREGDEVKEGVVIGRVVDDKLALQLNAANAKLTELNSQLSNAQSELNRRQQLFARDVASQAQIDQARMGYEVALNQVKAAQADKEVVEQRTREGDVLAPQTGRILTVPVRVGSVILAGEEIARIASGQYYLRLSLPERHAIDTKEGATVLIGQRGVSPAKGGDMAKAREGRIVKVYPEIIAGRVIADVDVAGLGDYFVNERTLVWVPVGTRTAIAVPPEAVTTRHGIDYIRVATPDGLLDVAVILGEAFLIDGKPRLEILTGLRDGDPVVLPDTAR
ncbi:efflux RND transporter periplasmic adaptor subunit [Methyloferula stellata]|uniref:efflux RND transporter periplasmic adaptor subunit n=1 Tax=Methyloferula stellata TaxID=876270 RepID=UPI00036FB6CA|nr:efflux RND transporter periplasmic adaptor subunit [Methyloferula stellata]